MLFGLHFMSHLTLYNDVHNTHAILTFSMYVGDVTVDETLSASASA